MVDPTHDKDHIKKISVDQLQIGMYVHDLNCPWWDHPYLTSRFRVNDETTLRELAGLGIRELYIDTRKGADVADAPTQREVDTELGTHLATLAEEAGPEPPVQVSRAEEMPRAVRLHGEANRIVRHMLNDVRLGRQIEMETVDPLVERMVETIFRNQDALLPLVRLKQHDSYTFQHSVSVCALMIAFARSLGMARPVIKEIGIGALLHDVGKSLVEDAILNKPGRLTDAEFSRMKDHVVLGWQQLESTPGVGPVARELVFQHHERYDGSGYPRGLRGPDISQHGRMAAIVDVYDAISSDRVYRKSMPAPMAMSKLLEWSKFHFDPTLTQAFIKSVGIYPSGSLVRLESGRLAVVLEQNSERLLLPVVRVVYHAVDQIYLRQETVNLARPGCQDRIIGFESFETWKLDPLVCQG